MNEVEELAAWAAEQELSFTFRKDEAGKPQLQARCVFLGEPVARAFADWGPETAFVGNVVKEWRAQLGRLANGG